MKKESIREGRAPARPKRGGRAGARPSREEKRWTRRSASLPCGTERTRRSASLSQFARPIAICQPVASKIWRPLAAKLENDPNVILQPMVAKFKSVA